MNWLGLTVLEFDFDLIPQSDIYEYYHKMSDYIYFWIGTPPLK